MERRKMRLACFALIAGFLCGCGNQIPQLSEEDHAKISEYAAAKLLSYDTMYHSRLLTDEELLVAQQKREEQLAREEAIAQYLASQEKDEASDKDAESNNGKDGKGEKEQKAKKPLAQLLGLDGIEITYLETAVLDSYPAEVSQISGNNLDDPLAAFFSMSASTGCKLVVSSFELANTTGQETTVDMLSKNVRFTLACDSFKRKSTLVTMLEDDFSTMSKIVAPGETIKAVIMCDVPAQQCETLSGLNLSVRFGEESENYDLVNINQKL